MASRSMSYLPPNVTKIIFVKNLPYKISSEELYDIFSKYGDIRQIRIGNRKETRGTAFVVYEDIYDAKNAVDNLSGFKVSGRFLVLLYYKASKLFKEADLEKHAKEIEDLKAKYGLSK